MVFWKDPICQEKIMFFIQIPHSGELEKYLVDELSFKIALYIKKTYERHKVLGGSWG